MNQKEYKVEIYYHHCWYKACLYEKRYFLFVPYWQCIELATHALLPYSPAVLTWQDQYKIPDERVHFKF